MNEFSLQPHLEGKLVSLTPLSETDFDALFAVASDPLIWEQHPNKERYKLDVFTNFFEGAMASNGAFIIKDITNDKVIGSTRFYDKNDNDKSVFIGYTFIARAYWGKSVNSDMKQLMLDYAFQYCDKVYFHVGVNNIRSQKAMEKIGGKIVKELTVEYYNEAPRSNYEFIILKSAYKNKI